MTQLRFVPASLFASAALLAAVLAPTPAHALVAPNTCMADTDCAKGFECSVVGTSGCAPAPACAPGSSCPEPEPCDAVVQKACTPAHCESNDDCAEGMVCFDFPTSCVTTDCACPPDSPDCGCAVAPCDPQPNKMCAPRYVVPCQAAADCGEGFTCEEQLSCGCSGSGGSDAGEPGATPTPAEKAAPADPAPPADCSCQPTGEMRCVAKEIDCATASDCPAGWTCSGRSAPAGDVPACAEGDDCAAALPLPAERLVCVPDYYSGGDDVAVPGTPTKGGVGTGTGTDNGGTTPRPEASGSDGESSESAACQMGHAPASKSVFGLLVVFGALLGLKRRRAQA